MKDIAKLILVAVFTFVSIKLVIAAGEETMGAMVGNEIPGNAVTVNEVVNGVMDNAVISDIMMNTAE